MSHSLWSTHFIVQCHIRAFHPEPQSNGSLSLPLDHEVSNDSYDQSGEGWSTCPRRCYVHSVWCHVLKNKDNETLSLQPYEDPREENNQPTSIEGLNKVQIDGPDKVVQIGVTLPNEQVEALTLLLIEFKEIFTWKPIDMSGISKDVDPWIEHRTEH